MIDKNENDLYTITALSTLELFAVNSAVAEGRQ